MAIDRMFVQRHRLVEKYGQGGQEILGETRAAGKSSSGNGEVRNVRESYSSREATILTEGYFLALGTEGQFTDVRELGHEGKPSF